MGDMKGLNMQRAGRIEGVGHSHSNREHAEHSADDSDPHAHFSVGAARRLSGLLGGGLGSVRISHLRRIRR